MSEAGGTEASDALPKYKNQQSNIEGRLQLKQRMRSTTCTTRSQPVELVVTNSSMSTRSSRGSHRGWGQSLLSIRVPQRTKPQCTCCAASGSLQHYFELGSLPLTSQALPIRQQTCSLEIYYLSFRKHIRKDHSSHHMCLYLC